MNIKPWLKPSQFKHVIISISSTYLLWVEHVSLHLLNHYQPQPRWISWQVSQFVLAKVFCQTYNNLSANAKIWKKYGLNLTMMYVFGLLKDIWKFHLSNLRPKKRERVSFSIMYLYIEIGETSVLFFGISWEFLVLDFNSTNL